MSLNEYVCKKHITQLNKTYKTSFFHEEPENNNNENQENNIFHEDPINNNSESIQNNNSQIQILQTESISNVIHHHHHHHHHHNCQQESNFQKNSSLSQRDDQINENADSGDDDKEDVDDYIDHDEDDGNDDEFIDTHDEEEDDEEVFVLKNDENEANTLTLEVSSAASSHSRCFVCKNYAGKNNPPFKFISNDGIIDVFVKKKSLSLLVVGVAQFI